MKSKNLPSLKLRVFVDDITALVKGKRSGGNCEIGDEKAERRSREERLHVVSH